MSIHTVADLKMIVDQSLSVEAANTQGTILPFDFRETVADIIAMVLPAALEKKISLTMEYDLQAPRFFVGDIHRIRGILVNCIAQGIFGTDAGRVQVVIEGTPPRGDEVVLLIQIRDTGTGISPDEAKLQFEVCCEGDRPLDSQKISDGSGLAISKHLLSLMHGALRIQSSPGKGSTVTITLPLRLDNASFSSEKITTNSSSTDKNSFRLRVLVVDDDDLNRQVSNAILSHLGCQVETASGGLQALEKIEKASYDLIVMDCLMPGIDGFETTRRIRCSGSPAQKVCIVAMTGYSLDEDRMRCLAAGMNDHVSKPVSLQSMRELLARCSKTISGSAVPVLNPSSVD